VAPKVSIFFQYWSLNSGPCLASALQVEPHPSPFCFIVFLDRVLQLLPGAGLESWSSYQYLSNIWAYRLVLPHLTCSLRWIFTTFFCPGWLVTNHDKPVSTCQVAGIADMYHHTWPWSHFLNLPVSFGIFIPGFSGISTYPNTSVENSSSNYLSQFSSFYLGT
jgi:hypothetical protein